MKGYYTEHAWMHPAFFKTLRIYGWLWESLWDDRSVFLVGGNLDLRFCNLLSVAALLIYKAVRADPKNEPHFHENILTSGFLLLPIVLFVMVKTTSHTLIAPRYLLLSHSEL